MTVLLMLTAGATPAQTPAAQTNPEPQGRIECAAMASKILKTQVRYCAFLPPSYDSAAAEASKAGAVPRRYPVLYFLHGLGDNERSLVNTGAWNNVEDLRATHKIGDFIIVTPDAGHSFYVNDRGVRYPYNDFFIREFMPFIEHHYSIRDDRTARGITGFSMGGFGALHFGFAYPKLFGSVSAESPALMPSPPRFASGADSGSSGAEVISEAFGNPIDLDAWNENSPFELARRNAAEVRRLKILIDCGQDDDYGFNRGTGVLGEELKSLKIAADVQIYPGRHDVTYFLAHFGQALEFHWRVFQTAER